MKKALAAALLLAPLVAWSLEAIPARARLKEAVAEAKKWKPDAALSAVATSNARPDGASEHWTYSFQSKSTRTCLRVVVLAEGPPKTTDFGECTLGTAIAEDFVDSPAALKAATAGGFKAGETINLTLVHLADKALTKARECWNVSSPEQDFDKAKAIMRGWCVDPKTGKFVVRLAGEHPGGRR